MSAPHTEHEPSIGQLRRSGTFRRRLAILLLLFLAGGVALAYAKGWNEILTLDFLIEKRSWLKQEVQADPFNAYAIFIGIYALATLLALPAAALLTITAGFLFGWFPGAAAAVTGATIGSTAIFLVARSAFGQPLRRRIRGRAAQLAMGFEANAFVYLLALRIAPVLPFFLLNIVPAAFNVSLRTYVAATFLGIIPGGLAYSYLGLGLDSVLIAAAQAGRSVTLRDIVTPQILVAFAALAVVAVLPTIVNRLRNRKTGDK